MRKYVVGRLLQLILILLIITFLSFGMMRLAGSDAILQKMENTGMVVSQDMIDAARAELGLDKPFLTQYFVWLGNLLHGDMGTSYISGLISCIYFKITCHLAAYGCVHRADDCDFDPAWCPGGCKTESMGGLLDARD